MNTKHQAPTVIPRSSEDSTPITLARARARAQANTNYLVLPEKTTTQEISPSPQPPKIGSQLTSSTAVHTTHRKNLTSLTANPDPVLMRLAWERRGGGGRRRVLTPILATCELDERKNTEWTRPTRSLCIVDFVRHHVGNAVEVNVPVSASASASASVHSIKYVRVRSRVSRVSRGWNDARFRVGRGFAR